MSAPGSDPLSRLTIPPGKKRSRRAAAWWPLFWVSLVLAVLLFGYQISQPRPAPASTPLPTNATSKQVPGSMTPPPSHPTPAATQAVHSTILLTATGYIVPRERIELSAKFPGTVASIQVDQGDRVKKGDVLVRLVDDEHRFLLNEARGRLALAQANLNHAQATYQRQQKLIQTKAATDQTLDDAQQALDLAQAQLQIAQAQVELASTKLAWCTTYAPTDGTVLQRLVDEHELIIPQAFGMAPDSPSPTLLTMANLSQLQVEVDVNELETPKVQLNQPCWISPIAYPDKRYTGAVAEIAPEANRQKGTLQVKIDIANPDRFLIPELNAKVDFLAE